jgi:putative tryptophan/tyrosine transport system substrate-binding protein
VSNIGVLVSKGVWEALDGQAIREAAKRAALALVAKPLSGPFEESEYRGAFDAMMHAGVDALVVGDQAEHFTNRQLIAELAEQNHLPAIYPYREQAEVGGLMAYAFNLPDLFHHAANQIDRIFRGAKPDEIPFYRATKFSFIINLRAAKALGLTIPPSLLARSDEVIE